MSLWHIAWGYIWSRKIPTAISIIAVALAVGLISAVLTLREETRKRFEEEGQSFDLVVGAKGNPLQLVLSTVYFLDAPTGNIKRADYERLLEEDDVKAAFPVGLGDTFRGYRIVGTVRGLFEYDWGERNPYLLREGHLFEKPMEAVLGAMVAERMRMKVGQTFVGTHGFVEGGHVHGDKPYTVVGILKRSGTPNDRAIFTDIQSVWDVHAQGHDHDHGESEIHEGEHEDAHDEEAAHDPSSEVTAVLVKLASPALRFEYEALVNERFNAMAVVPVNEVRKLYDQLLGTAKAVLLAIGYLVVVVSSLTIMLGLYMAILQRKRDLAIMRALGATRGEVFGSILIEALLVTGLGLVVGWVLGTTVCWGLGIYLTKQFGFHVSAISFSADLISSYSIVLLMGLAAGLLPAVQAYRTAVAENLHEG